MRNVAGANLCRRIGRSWRFGEIPTRTPPPPCRADIAVWCRPSLMTGSACLPNLARDQNTSKWTECAVASLLSPLKALLARAAILVLGLLTLELSSRVRGNCYRQSSLEKMSSITSAGASSRRDSPILMKIVFVKLLSKLSSVTGIVRAGTWSRVPDPIDIWNVVFVELLGRFQSRTFPMNLKPFAGRSPQHTHTPCGAARP